MKIRPLQDRMIVRKEEAAEKSQGGIIIPDSAKEKPVRGEVLAIGNGKLLENGNVRPMDIKQGDVVLFSKYAGTEIKVEGEDFLILKEEDVLGIVQK